jgi:hypothetical protein
MNVLKQKPLTLMLPPPGQKNGHNLVLSLQVTVQMKINVFHLKLVFILMMNDKTGMEMSNDLFLGTKGLNMVTDNLAVTGDELITGQSNL